MKKLILSMVFVFATITMVNAKENIEISGPSDCVKSSRAAVEAIANEYGWDIHNGGSESKFAVELFMVIYKDCLGGPNK